MSTVLAEHDGPVTTIGINRPERRRPRHRRGIVGGNRPSWPGWNPPTLGKASASSRTRCVSAAGTCW
ncbi:hypothetical protein G3I59_22220 [Amycolatopsis rubida]|uniref:Uncharacterized protein n=1 Tax=Amycolatopsis rubida TaxID=112413 RepID=A0ABX0BSB8_9PSEU|nr:MULTISPECIES: hypothetical protein [Amycolatopsis]MYW93259.1 hypothetical protein [Amycolatopsis rubida]NEC58246.1 hypothetical protein [Amycolatopsis rubida]